MRAIKNPEAWKPLLTVGAIAFLYFSVLRKLAFDWWSDDNYSHGLLVPFVIGFIVWLEFDKLRTIPRKSQFELGLSTVLLALLMLLGGSLGAELFTQRVSLVLLLAGAVVYFFGVRVLRNLAVPFLLLLLSIPIPQLIFNKIALPLQIWASQIADWGIKLVGIASVRKGNVIELIPLGGAQIAALEVVEACSGIRSLMTLLTLALVLAYFTKVRDEEFQSKGLQFVRAANFWRAVILMITAVPIALLTNAARVTATGVLTYYYGQEFAVGWWHDVSGWLVFVGAVGLLVGVNSVLQLIFRKDGGRVTQESASPFLNEAAPVPNHRVVFLFIVILTGGVLINWLEHRGEVQPERRHLATFPLIIGDAIQRGQDIRFSAPTESILRASDYVMRDYRDSAGQKLNLYIGYYASQRTGATYHSPQSCLPGSGWQMEDRQLVEIQRPENRRFTANRYIVRNGGYRGVMIYWYQGRGRTNSSEYRDKAYTVLDSILRRRSDSSMVRVMVPVEGDEARASQAALDFAALVADRLDPYVPN